MKISHEREAQVSRFVTVGDALKALHHEKKRRTNGHHIDLVEALMYGSLHAPEPATAHPQGTDAIEELRHRVLSRDFEGLQSYKRCLALVSFSRAWSMPKVFEQLDSLGYAPAGLNESVAYLRVLRDEGAAAGTIFHLGTHYVNERYEEQKLLVHADGTVELVTIYGTTQVRPYWRIVAAKKEKKPSAESVIFGRKI